VDLVKEVIFKNRRMKHTKLLICWELHWGQFRGSQHFDSTLNMCQILLPSLLRATCVSMCHVFRERCGIDPELLSKIITGIGFRMLLRGRVQN
jgi:hypothetical protein